MEHRPTRRTEGARPGGRSARVVQAALDATLEAIARVGYAALRVDDVARASGVHKTTIYRRWPTKAELVQDAVDAVGDEPPPLETGDLRADLVRALLVTRDRLAIPARAAVMRMLQAERANPEVAAISARLRARHRAVREGMVARAIARGDLPAGADAALITEIILSTVHARLLLHGDAVDEAYIGAVVDTVLAGAARR